MMMQFMQYLVSGGAAVVLTVAAYAFLVWIGVWYVAASVLSDGIGFIAAFIFHKYLVFQKKEHVIPHAVRYTVLQIANTIVQAAIVYVLVEYIASDKVLARIVSIGVCVPVNFFVYKYWVYV